MLTEEQRKDFIEQLKKEASNQDHEVAHITADNILCEILNTLGYSDIVEAFNEIFKWYA